MLVIGKVLRAVSVGCAAVLLAGCTTSAKAPDVPPDTTVIDAKVVTAALLAPADIGPTWKVSPGLHPDALMALCGGGEDAPPVPGTPSVAASPLVDQGDKGLQTLDQVALVYPEAADAIGGLAALQVSANACAPSISVPAQVSDARSEAAYKETLAVSPLTMGQWTGFLVERHKLYEPTHPAAADTAVAVLSLHNVLLVDSYAIYVLGAKAAAPKFADDWHNLISATASRVTA